MAWAYVLYHLLVKFFVPCEVIDESHVLSSPWCLNFELFAPFFLGDWGAYLYHVTLIKVVYIVSTQKANRAARFSAARFIARHIEVETPRLHVNVIIYLFLHYEKY